MQFWQLTGSQRQLPSFGRRLTWGCISARLSISNLTKEAPTQNDQTHFFFFSNSEWLWLRQVSRQAGRPYIKSRSSNGEHFIKKSSLHPPNSSFKTLEDYQSKARRSKLVTARQCHKVIGSLFTSQKFFSGIQQKISQVECVPSFFFIYFFFCFRLCGESLRQSGDENLLQSSLTCPLHTHSIFLHILSFAESDLEPRRLNGGRQTEEISIPLVAAVPFSLSGVGSLPRNVTEY